MSAAAVSVLCPHLEDHTPSPEGYIAWHSWAATMASTHRQRKCPDCGLYAIWEPKGASQLAQRAGGAA